MSFDDFEAHAAVVVGTLPETGMVVAAVDMAFGIAAPEPFAEFVVDEVVLDVLPTAEGFVACGFVAEMLVDVEETYDGFGLYPPMAVSINMARIDIGFVGHRTVRVEPLFRSLCHKPYDGFHLFEDVFFA